jgi:hypothetical protein
MFLKGLLTRAVTALRDPIKVATEREEIKAAARHWRERLANARICQVLDGYMGTSVNSPFTERELNLFELAMAHELAIAMSYPMCGAYKLFQECGMDITGFVTLAARNAGLASKITYNGFYTRLRILVDEEVSYEREPYQSNHWVRLWSAAEQREKERIAA